MLLVVIFAIYIFNLLNGTLPTVLGSNSSGSFFDVVGAMKMKK